jgi:thioredoxin-dependent peroxiredoxin
VRDEIRDYQAANVRPLGVNPAPVESHAGYAERLGLPFALLSDPGMAISRAYGALRPDGSGISRSVVLVDHDGLIRYSQAGAPGSDIVLESLRSS